MEPGTLKGVGQAQGGELEPAQETASIPNVNGLSGVGADAPPEELIGSTAPRPTMSRRDVYAQPMRAGRPLSTGPMTRFTTWLKMTLSSELQRREWSVDEQLAHAPTMTRPNTVAVISPKGGVGKTTISFVLGNLLADSTQIDSPAELNPYVARLPTGLHLLGAPAHAEVMAQMTPGLYSRLLDFLERFYEVVILDLGTGITDPLAQFAVDRADQTVVITTPEWVTAAGVLGALWYLQLEQGTLVLNQAPTGRHAGNRDVIEANFRRHAVETSATIPYDDRLRVMLDTGTYSLSSLKLGTRVPVKGLGAAIAYNFV